MSGRRTPLRPRVHRQARLGSRILLVEDNPDNRRLAARVLEGAGAVVDNAENGETAVAMARETLYDLILMDLMMPVMDGFEAAVRIRENEIRSQPGPHRGLDGARDRRLSRSMPRLGHGRLPLEAVQEGKTRGAREPMGRSEAYRAGSRRRCGQPPHREAVSHARRRISAALRCERPRSPRSFPPPENQPRAPGHGDARPLRLRRRGGAPSKRGRRERSHRGDDRAYRNVRAQAVSPRRERPPCCRSRSNEED